MMFGIYSHLLFEGMDMLNIFQDAAAIKSNGGGAPLCKLRGIQGAAA